MSCALIIGGSLGGLFAGLLLRQAGWDVTVFERSSGDLASRGVGIGTHVEMFEVMRRLGITVDESVGVAFTSRVCLDRSGAEIARLPFDKVLSSWTLFYRTLSAFCRTPAIGRACSLTTSRKVRRRHRDFADGTKVEGDLLVGVDGLNSTVRARVFTGPAPSYAGYVAWRGVIEEQAVPSAARLIVRHHTLFVPAREMMIAYLQPGADDDHRPGRRRMNWLWYHPVRAAMLPNLCTDASGRHHSAAIPPPLIRPDVIAAFHAEARAILPPQFIALVEATTAPFFQPIFDLESPHVVAGRVALLGDAAFVSRPHVGAGVTKAALNAAWLTDALAATPDDIDAALAAYERQTCAFGSAIVARARYLGAYLEDPPRAAWCPIRCR